MPHHSKPYRLYFRKDTGYWFYRLPGGKWKTTGCRKEHEAHAYAMDQAQHGQGQLSLVVEGPGQVPLLRDFAR